MSSTVTVSSPLAVALKEALRSAADAEAQIAMTERRYTACVARVTMSVLNQKGEDGKAAFGNDAMRKAAVEEAIAADMECRDLAAMLDSLRCQKAYALADAESLKATIRLSFGQMVRSVNGF